MKNSRILLYLTPALLAIPNILQAATITHNLNVEIIQVFSDAGSDASPIVANAAGGGGSYTYESEVNEIWNQAGIQVTFSYSTWNNTEAQRLTSTERSAVYANTFTSTTGSALPGIGTDTLQMFYVWDHPGTGYNGTTSSGWKNDASFNHATSAGNAGNAQLYIDGTYSSIGRGVVSNRGFATAQLSGTLAHEIGHALGLRHVDSVNAGGAAGSTQDPDYSTVATSTNNLMWAGGSGPGYNSSLNNDPSLTVLQENEAIFSAQTIAAIYNGTRLDPDGNGIGVLQAIPEPSTFSLILLGLFPLLQRKRL